MEEFQFHQRCEMQKLVSQFGQLLAEATSHLVHGQTVGSCRGRCDKISHGFSLTQVHLSVQECPLCEFSWCGLSASCADEASERFAQYELRAVAGYLYGVFTCIRPWSTEKTDEDLVERVAISIIYVTIV